MLCRLLCTCLLAGLFLIVSCSKSNDATPAKTVPAVPIAAAATAISQTAFTASWDAVPDATDYRLDVSMDNFATFVTGYSNKTVTSFSDIVSGLTAATAYKYRVRSSNTNGISANSNEITVTTSAATVTASGSATLGGAAFTATTSKATDTGSGLELILADASSKITLSLSDKTAGAYTIVNSSSGRPQALSYTISVLKGGVIYNGVTGSLVISANSDGTRTAAFDGTLKSSTGLTLTMSSGKLLNFSVAPVPSSGCKITSITASYPSTCDGAVSVSFFYNSDGKISKAIFSDGTSQTFNYDLVGKLIGSSAVSSSGTETTELTYSGNSLTSYVDRQVLTGQSGTNTTYTFSYSAGSTISSVASTKASNTTGTRTISLSNGNLVSHANSSTTSGITSSTTYTYAAYDTKKNPWALLASLTGTPVSFVYDGGINLGYFDFQSVSANNPSTVAIGGFGSIPRTFTYTYNAQNYPTQIVYTYDLGTGCSITYAIVYSGCQ